MGRSLIGTLQGVSDPSLVHPISCPQYKVCASGCSSPCSAHSMWLTLDEVKVIRKVGYYPFMDGKDDRWKAIRRHSEYNHPENVRCQMCLKPCKTDTAHLSNGVFIGECCKASIKPQE